MKKIKILLLITLLAAIACLTSCNRTVFDTQYTFDKAIIQRAGGEQVVDIKSWRDYDGEQIQLELTDGSVIVVSSYNTILVCTKEGKSLIFD